MTTNKDIAIGTIKEEFGKMANLVLTQLDLLDKILQSDKDEEVKQLGKDLVQNEKDLDNFEIILDNKIVQAIVLYKPVASELRNIFALYRMTINLERIGDLIVKVYYFSQDLEVKYFRNESSQYFLNMLESVTKMVRNAVLSFINNNIEDAIKTIEKDAEIDTLNQKLLKKTLSKMKVDKGSRELILNFVDIRSMISSVERMGDQATNIAEASIYAMTGTNIAHKEFKQFK